MITCYMYAVVRHMTRRVKKEQATGGENSCALNCCTRTRVQRLMGPPSSSSLTGKSSLSFLFPFFFFCPSLFPALTSTSTTNYTIPQTSRWVTVGTFNPKPLSPFLPYSTVHEVQSITCSLVYPTTSPLLREISLAQKRGRQAHFWFQAVFPYCMYGRYR